MYTSISNKCHMNISYYKLKKTLIPYFIRGGISFSVCEQRSCTHVLKHKASKVCFFIRRNG